jgi:hypothetical protein
MGWTACYATPHEVQAWLVKGYLEQYGVPCMVAGGRCAASTLGPGEVSVLVHADWLDIARGLLRSRDAETRGPRLRLVRGSDPS